MCTALGRRYSTKENILFGAKMLVRHLRTARIRGHWPFLHSSSTAAPGRRSIKTQLTGFRSVSAATLHVGFLTLWARRLQNNNYGFKIPATTCSVAHAAPPSHRTSTLSCSRALCNPSIVLVQRRERRRLFLARDVRLRNGTLVTDHGKTLVLSTLLSPPVLATPSKQKLVDVK